LVAPSLGSCPDTGRRLSDDAGGVGTLLAERLAVEVGQVVVVILIEVDQILNRNVRPQPSHSAVLEWPAAATNGSPATEIVRTLTALVALLIELEGALGAGLVFGEPAASVENSVGGGYTSSAVHSAVLSLWAGPRGVRTTRGAISFPDHTIALLSFCVNSRTL
jgi:hypothetical protein